MIIHGVEIKNSQKGGIALWFIVIIVMLIFAINFSGFFVTGGSIADVTKKYIIKEDGLKDGKDGLNIVIFIFQNLF